MTRNEGVIWAVAEAHSPAWGLDLRLVAGSTKDIQKRRTQAAATQASSGLSAGVGAGDGAMLPGDIGYCLDRRSAAQPVEGGRHELGGTVVLAWRERHGDLAVPPSIKLGRTPRPWATATAPPPVLGLEQAGLDQTIEVEGRQLAADLERSGRIVTADRLVAVDHQAMTAETTPFAYAAQPPSRSTLVVSVGVSFRVVVTRSPPASLPCSTDGREWRIRPPAKEYTRRIEVDGKTWREAIRALKRRLVRPVYRLLLEGSDARLAAA